MEKQLPRKIVVVAGSRRHGMGEVWSSAGIALRSVLQSAHAARAPPRSSQQGFRRLKGHKDMPTLIAALRAHDQTLGIAVSVENVA
jgi:hypothetical protein